MDIFNVLTMAGGLSLFLFGMSVMSEALERRAEGSLKLLLARLTQKKIAGFLTGLVVTAVIQSSSAATVMVVGFVNSGVMTLKQAINVIMGANVGTTVTAWLLSLSGISGDNLLIRMLKPTSFTPILATVGILLFMLGKTSKKKDSGTILLGFATLMFGMDTMTGAVAGLADVPAFRQLFVLFQNPILGILVGAVLTAVIQSSSASVGILQALASTGQVSYGAAMPIIMGQNIGTCATALLSSFGTTKNAKRTAVVHLSFNILGTLILLLVFLPVSLFVKPLFLNEPASLFGIALTHSAFNILCTLLLLPASSLLERLAIRLVPDTGSEETAPVLDERLLATPHIALDRCETLIKEMAEISTTSLKKGMSLLTQYDNQLAKEVTEAEETCDHYEDILGTYLVKLSHYQMSDADSGSISMMLKMIGDLERISDHSINILKSAEELREKKMQFTDEAKRELAVLCSAVSEIMTLSCTAFVQNDLVLSQNIEPLEQVIDDLKEAMRDAHVLRLKNGVCSIETGFIWLDLLTNLERAAAHCSNIAICIVDAAKNSMSLHYSLSVMKAESSYYKDRYTFYSEKYVLPKTT